MKLKNLYGELALLLAALVWGFGFVAQSLGMDYIDEFTLIGTRNILAVIALEPIILLRDRKNPKPSGQEKRKLIKGGVIIGVLLVVASAAQQFAISWTGPDGTAQPVGKVSFLTAMYMVLVPAFGVCFGRKSSIKTWISVAVGCVGMYLLCGLAGKKFSLNAGDLFGILCAVLYAFQILAIDAFAPDVDCVRLSQYEFAVCGVLSMILAFVFEEVTLSSIWAGRLAILYLGLLSSGVGYTLQIVGQKYTKPQVSSLIMCLESVFGAFAGYLILNEKLSASELIGAALMMAAVVVSQIEFNHSKN